MNILPDADQVIKILEYIPHSKQILTIGLSGLFITLIVIPIYRARKGDEISVFGQVIMRPDKANQELKDTASQLNKLMEELNQDSKQKTNLIKLFSDISAEITALMTINDRTVFEDTVQKMYDFILPAIQTNMTKLQDNSHRVAVFIPKDSKLIIAEGMGFTPTELKSIELDILNSFAGRVYLSGERAKTGNVDNDPYFAKNVKANLSYKSLACVPIKTQDKVIGVLSMDGLLENSFTDNDLSYLCFFANLLAIILKMSEFKEEMRYNKIERGWQDERDKESKPEEDFS